MTQTVTLQRIQSSAQGTIGRLLGLYTLELPWHDNMPGESCIPEGTYNVVWSLSPRLKKYTYEIQGVPNRAGIRVHSGNFAGDKPQYLSHSLGCPLIGSRIGTVNGQVAVLASRSAVRKFELLMNRKNFILEIKNA